MSPSVALPERSPSALSTRYPNALSVFSLILITRVFPDTHGTPTLQTPPFQGSPLRVPILRRRVNPRGFLAVIPIFRRVGTAGGGDFLESPVFNSVK